MRAKQKNFIKQQLKNSLSIPAVYTIHYFKYGNNFRFPEENHNFYELVYIDSGNAVVLSDGIKTPLSQGEAYLHKPNEKHTIYTEGEFANSAIISFECKDKILTELCGKILSFNTEQKSILNKVINEAKISYSDPLNDLNLTKMNKRLSSPFGGEQIIKNCIELLLISLLRKEILLSVETTPMVDGLHSPIIEGIKQILSEKISKNENVSLEELSIKLGYSKSYLKTKFKQETGKSILQFFINMKIEKAKKLLSQGNKTINEVSDILGFSYVQYFCRQFKLYTDMTPSEYVVSIKTDHLI